MKELTKAIRDLAPGAQWLLEGDDLSNLIWLDNSIERPTDKAILDRVKYNQNNRDIIFEKFGISKEELQTLLS